MAERHEDFLMSLVVGAHIILDRGVAAGKTMFIAQTLKNTF